MSILSYGAKKTVFKHFSSSVNNCMQCWSASLRGGKALSESFSKIAWIFICLEQGGWKYVSKVVVILQLMINITKEGVFDLVIAPTSTMKADKYFLFRFVFFSFLLLIFILCFASV